MVRCRAERVGVPSFVHDYWTPLLEMCNDTGVPLNFHLNAAMDPNTLTWEGFSFEQTLSVVATMFSIGNAATLGNWIVSGRLDQFPKLKIALVESGMGWIPFALEALEHQFNEMLPSKANMLHRRPWDYFRDQFWVTYWFETVAQVAAGNHRRQQGAVRDGFPPPHLAVPRRAGTYRGHPRRLRSRRAAAGS